MPFPWNAKPTNECLLRDLKSPSVEEAWALVNQTVVDRLFSRYTRKFTGIKFLDQNLAPCCPGSVLLVRERSFKEWFLRRDKPAVFGGQIQDFYDERTLKLPNDVTCLRQRKPQSIVKGRLRMNFATADQKKKVKIELWNLELNSSEGLKPKAIKMDLDNFTNTGFHDDYFYLVKHTITVDRIRIKVCVNGETNKFDERVSRTIGFAADLVRLTDSGSIHRSKTRPIYSRLPIKLFPRKDYALLINNLMPNQSRFGGAVGDLQPPEDDVPSSRLRRIQRMRLMALSREEFNQMMHQARDHNLHTEPSDNITD